MMRGVIGLAAALALAAFTGGAAAQARGEERCYGVSRAGQNDGMGGNADPGSAVVDFQGNAWTVVPAGTCLTMPLPPQPDGTPRRGSFEALERDRPPRSPASEGR